MVMKIFSIYDVKAELYNQPFFMPARGQALREFADLVNDSQSRISKHPADYKLVCIGSFDDVTGEIVSAEHESLGRGDEFVNGDSGKVVSLGKS
ncbi:MAG: nonstructural protein [Microviridae sp.]|nr:MAG: nonstructural protein [Microviridae sp.]